MPQTILPHAPAGFAPEVAVTFADATGAAIVVDPTHGLPVAGVLGAATSTPLTGSTSASGVVGPFTPQLGRPVWITLASGWSGSVAVQRSLDGGTTKRALTVAGEPWAVFTGPAQEPVGEETVTGATWYLAVTLASGALAYEVRQ